MGHLDLTVHYCDWSSQPDIHILCDGSWTEPAWENGPPSALQRILNRREIYQAEDERYYTFEESTVTCKKCRARMKPEAA